jgi:O-antigen ligase
MSFARASALSQAAFRLLELGLLLLTPLVIHRGFSEQFSTIKIILTESLILAAALLVAVGLLWGWIPWPKAFHLGAPLVLLVGGVLISCLASPLPRFSFVEAFSFLCGPAWLACLVFSGGGESRVRWLAALVSIAATAMAGIALLQWAGRDPLLFGGYSVDWGRMRAAMRLYSTLGNPNFVAGYLIGAIFLALALATTAKTAAGKLAGMISAALMFATLIGTRSRGAWLALVAGLLVARLFPRRSSGDGGAAKPARLAARAVVPLGLALLPNLASQAAVLAARFQGRLFLWRAAWPMFLEHPLIGTGWGMFQMRFPELQARYLASHARFAPYWTHTSQLHNDLLQLLLEAGAVGLAAFGWLLWRYARSLKSVGAASGEARPWLAASAGGVTAMLVNSLFNFQFAIVPTLILLFTLLSLPDLLRPEIAEADTTPGQGRLTLRIVVTAAALAVVLTLTHGIWTRAAGDRWLARGMTQERRGDFAAAETSFRKGMERTPCDGRLHYGLARALFVQGRHAEALTEVLRAESTVADAHLEVLRARILDQMGESSRALQAYQHALWLNPHLRTVPADIRRLQSGAAAAPQ